MSEDFRERQSVFVFLCGALSVGGRQKMVFSTLLSGYSVSQGHNLLVCSSCVRGVQVLQSMLRVGQGVLKGHEGVSGIVKLCWGVSACVSVCRRASARAAGCFRFIECGGCLPEGEEEESVRCSALLFERGERGEKGDRPQKRLKLVRAALMVDIIGCFFVLVTSLCGIF